MLLKTAGRSSSWSVTSGKSGKMSVPPKTWSGVSYFWTTEKFKSATWHRVRTPDKMWCCTTVLLLTLLHTYRNDCRAVSGKCCSIHLPVIAWLLQLPFVQAFRAFYRSISAQTNMFIVKCIIGYESWTQTLSARGWIISSNVRTDILIGKMIMYKNTIDMWPECHLML
jgi:hypothetical protein